GDPELFEIEHNKGHDAPLLDLKSRVRVFALEVLDREGNPIPAARVRVVGSPDPPSSRQRFQGPNGWANHLLIATLEDRVDVEISDATSTFETRIVTGVNADCEVVLEPV